jgi:hypothetical protein
VSLATGPERSPGPEPPSDSDHHLPMSHLTQPSITRLLEVRCSFFGHRWTPWQRPVRLIETCRCDRCGMTRTRRLGLV